MTSPRICVRLRPDVVRRLDAVVATCRAGYTAGDTRSELIQLAVGALLRRLDDCPDADSRRQHLRHLRRDEDDAYYGRAPD